VPVDRLNEVLRRQLVEVDAHGTRKRVEAVVTAVLPAASGRGPRYLLAGYGDKLFVRMSSNGYLGLAMHPAVMAAEEQAVRSFGAGPAAVRFISGTYEPHVRLEHRLAEFHGREAAMIFGSAYAAMIGVLPALVSGDTAIVSDSLNHNCIINAARLAQPKRKEVYPHLDLAELDRVLGSLTDDIRRVLVVTDGVFSMRGDHAPLDALVALLGAHDQRFAENTVLIVDDSHGVGAIGTGGRGTEEVTGGQADVLVATLGKALGVNGGYVVGSQTLVDHLRETAPTYIYSNPITPAEAAAALAALELLVSDAGAALLARLRANTTRFRDGITRLGYETIPGVHPVVPVLVRDTTQTHELVAHLLAHGVLATGLSYPVVPRGDEEIRFQLSADQTAADIDEVLEALSSYRTTS
jgi:glycine C-acetyltransferase